MLRNEEEKMATLLIGYDVEHMDANSGITHKFLEVAPKLHRELEAPCTFFVCGRTLEANLNRFKKVFAEYSDMIDFQQHTYSHVLLKTVFRENQDGVTVFKGGTLEKIREEVAKSSALLKGALEIDCIGITGPYGYYRGLADRPDILDILHELGIRFTRTYARNEQDWQPVPFEIQPFWYQAQGFPDIFEFPVQGWQDCILRGKLGWKDRDGYLNYLKSSLEYIAEHNLVWGYATHDWSSITEDSEMWITRNMIEYAQKLGIKLTNYAQYYYEAVEQKKNS